MKKTFVLMTALAISCATVKAQKASFGVKGGVQQNSIVMKQEEGSDWNRYISSGTGFHVGGLADISLTNNISVQPALLFNSKSALMNSEVSFKLYTLDVPVNFLYKTGGFFLGLGPNMSYGLSAKFKSDGEDQSLYEKLPIGEGDEEKSMLKRFEVGANVTMGYQFKNNLLISTNYTQGLSNLSNITESEFGKVRTRQIGISIGYVFGK